MLDQIAGPSDALVSAVNRINIAKQPELTDEHKIKRIPTFVVIENDRETKRFEGVPSEEQLQQLLRLAVNGSKTPAPGRY